jgi:hypothetical protein
MTTKKFSDFEWRNLNVTEKTQTLVGYGTIVFVGVVSFALGKRRGRRYPWS